ncbi:hypothetical protein HDU99_006159 [Rhizoclosmatium hyalinum]|nr:hypothetical protein HDU99_006159 [Rhizoclosmatium hyalinum]
MLWSVIAVAAALVQAAAPLEPADGKIFLGAWYDRNNSDTPNAINQRFNYKPLSFFQTDIDMSGVKWWTAPEVVLPQFRQQLKDTKTDAFAMLTVYPFGGFDAITEKQLADMATGLNNLVNDGHQVFFRFASEMNGSWFQYGQDPIGFVNAWRKFVTYWRKALGPNASKVAFIWSPNSGNGYPFLKQEFSFNVSATDAKSLANFKALDTNGDGVYDKLDDPYTPFYPGDEYVDWVGISIYHYGSVYNDNFASWIDNVIPDSSKFEKFLNGFPAQGNDYGYAPLYTYFSSPTGVKDPLTGAVLSKGGKPMIISETAATYHFAWKDPAGKPTPVPDTVDTVTRLQIKQAWWKSFLNTEFLAKYPQIKAASTFEFIKDEEATWRDFTMFGAAPNTQGGPSFAALDNDVVQGFAKDVQNMTFLAFANVVGNATITKTTSGAVSTASITGMVMALGAFFLSL